GTQLEMQARVAGEFDFAWVDHDEFGAAPDGLFDARPDDGMILSRVAAADEDCRGTLDVVERVGRGSSAERLFHSGGAGGVTDARAAVHVVCAQNDAGELLRKIILFVRPARRTQHADGVRAKFFEDLSEAV